MPKQIFASLLWLKSNIIYLVSNKLLQIVEKLNKKNNNLMNLGN